MTIAPENFDLIVYQGATFEEDFFWEIDPEDGSPVVPVNLSGFTGRMQARLTAGAAGEPWIDLDNGLKGGITLTAEGRISIFLSATATAALSFTEGVYDLELAEPGGRVIRFLAGKITLSREVTV